MDVKVNKGTQRFELHSEIGVSFYGFQNCLDAITELANRMGLEYMDPAQFGTMEQYLMYRKYIGLFSNHPSNRLTWFDAGTATEVKRILELAIESGKKLRLFFGDAETGRDWMEEYDTVGKIGRSTGPMRVPLLLDSKGEGGPAILTRNVIRIQNATNGQDLYVHPEYQEPVLRNTPIADGSSPGLTWKTEVKIGTEWEEQARHKSEAHATRYLEFICGQRVSQRATRQESIVTSSMTCTI